MAFTLPRLSGGGPIVDSGGKPTTTLQRWWQTIVEAIEGQEAGQDSVLSQIQASLALGGAGQVTADAAGATAKSGQATASGLTIDSAAWVAGPIVPLTGVGAPMVNLTLTGSAPLSAVLTGGPMDGEYRIVEVGPALTLFTGRFTVKTTNTGAVIITLGNPVNTQIFPRATVGAVSYRMDLRKTAGAGVATALSAYLFARRAP